MMCVSPIASRRLKTPRNSGWNNLRIHRIMLAGIHVGVWGIDEVVGADRAMNAVCCSKPVAWAGQGIAGWV